MRKVTVILTVAALVGALALLLLKVGRFSDSEHERFQGGLWRLKHLDTAFNQDLLKARFALLENYDDFQSHDEELRRLVELLRHPPTAIDQAGRAAIEEARAHFAGLLLQRQALFERFKTKNAMLANSRRYLPVALDELAARLGSTGQDQELTGMLGDVARLALSRQSKPEAPPGDTSDRLRRFDDWLAAHPGHPESQLALSLIRHLQNIVARSGEVDALTRQLLDLETAASIEGLFQSYDAKVAEALQRAQQSRSLLHGLGMVMTVGIAYVLWALRAVNSRLEHRVAERTQELQRAQSFLNSVIENLPVPVFIKEAEELRFVMWNKAGEHLTGIPNQEMVGKCDHDFFPGPEAEKFIAIDREVLRTGIKLEISEEQLQTRHNGIRTVQVTKVPVTNCDGQANFLLGIALDITERKAAEAKLSELNRRLRDTSRQAGMAEVATGVLHNVGNVLNSVNVSATLLSDRLKKSKAAGFARVAALVGEHAADLPGFFTTNPRAAQLPDYLAQFAAHLATEREALLGEVENLRKNIDHIKEIVAMQQSYANLSGVTELVKPAELIEDTLRMNAGALDRHAIEVVQELEDVAAIVLDKHKVLQILVNFVRNAKYACDDSGRADKRIVVRLRRQQDRVQFAVSDNGVGIPAGNLGLIFNHGFTTRKDGHGFGLHSGANAAKEMGGSLKVHSDGPGRGACFTLELPMLQEVAPSSLQAA